MGEANGSLSSPFFGILDNVRIYNTLLSSSSIAALYAQDAAPSLAVSLTSPTAGATVSSTVSVVALATSTSAGIKNVQFQLDGANIGSAVTSSPWQISWDTTQYSTGSHLLTAIATDNASNTLTSASVNVTVANNGITGITPSSSLPSAPLNIAYSQTLTANGGIAPFVWSISSGTLPTGLSLNTASVAATTTISGTPTVATTTSFTVKVVESGGASSTQSYTLTAYPTLSGITPTTFPNASIDVPYSQTLTATNGIAPYTWSIASGTLPFGLFLNTSSTAATTTISGTPSFPSASNFTIGVLSAGVSTTQASAITINPATGCSYTLTDFSAGTDGNPVTAPTLVSSTFGISGPTWSVSTSTYFTYSTSAHHAFGGPAPAQCTNPWPGDVGNLGITTNVPNAGSSTSATLTLPVGHVSSTVTAGVWFETNYPATSSINIDVFNIFSNPGGKTNYTNVSFQSGGGMNLSLESPANASTSCTGHGSGNGVLINPNTWYWVTIQYTADTSGALQNEVQVYDASLNQVGRAHSTSCLGTVATTMQFGANAAIATAGYNINFDKATLCYTGTCPYPLLPNVNPGAHPSE